MKYKMRKAGNSLAVTIPSYIVENLNLKNGDTMKIELQGQKIILRKEEN